jgi:hypothetical protein
MSMKDKRGGKVDPRKLEELKRLARKTECLAMELACELQLNGSGHPDPPVLSVMAKRKGEGSTDGSGHPDPPVLDAIVDIAYGARKIREGAGALT